MVVFEKLNYDSEEAKVTSQYKSANIFNRLKHENRIEKQKMTPLQPLLRKGQRVQMAEKP